MCQSYADKDPCRQVWFPLQLAHNSHHWTSGEKILSSFDGFYFQNVATLRWRWCCGLTGSLTGRGGCSSTSPRGVKGERQPHLPPSSHRPPHHPPPRHCVWNLMTPWWWYLRRCLCICNASLLQSGKGRQEQGSRVDKEDKERQGEDIMVDKDIRFFEKITFLQGNSEKI